MIRASTRSTGGAVERDVFRLGIGPRPQVHHDLFPAVQAFQPLAAPAGEPAVQRRAGRDGAARAWFSGGPACAADSCHRGSRGPRRTEELGPTGTETRGGRDLTDGQTRLMGFGDGPDPLALGLFQAFRA